MNVFTNLILSIIKGTQSKNPDVMVENWFHFRNIRAKIC